MRVYIMQLGDSKQNVVFLYDPIFVESGKESYVIFWSRLDTNKTMEQEILRHKEKDSDFHTFPYPLRKVSFIRSNRELPEADGRF